MENSNRYNCSCDECVEKSKFPLILKLRDIHVCLSNLTELDLSHSGICEVPALIGNLVNMVKLNLSSNKLDTLPQSFTKFQYLTDLILSHNKFTLVPQCLINGMHSLTTLDLSYNELLDVSVKPFCIQRLLTLNISNNSKLNSLPRWLWSIECKSLESLDISFTKCLDNIETDPYLNMYGVSNHLKCLNVSNTNSDVLKLDFIKHLKNLRTLVLSNNDTICNKSHNYFSSVPLVFNYRFKFIASLSMSNVSLSSIGRHVYFSLPNLRFLNLSHNSIVLLPESFCELTNLEDCDFSNNQISALPQCFKSLKNLKRLVLNNNWLTEFPEIQEDLSNLEYLDLYANKLTVCPSWNSKIKSVDLEQNVFSTENSINQNLLIADYQKLLKNLRLSINENRITGPLHADEPNDLESFNGSVGSSSHWSLNSYPEDGLNTEVECQEANNFQPEECWECDSYEHTTALFNPKEFELSLMEELIKLEKPLTCAEKSKEKNILRNVVRSSNEHYFCPSDDLPRILSIQKLIV